MIADLSRVNPIAIMIFALRHNAPAILSAQPTNLTAQVVFVLPPARLIPSARAISRIAVPDHVFNAPLIRIAQIHHIAQTKLAPLPLTERLCINLPPTDLTLSLQQEDIRLCLEVDREG